MSAVTSPFAFAKPRLVSVTSSARIRFSASGICGAGQGTILCTDRLNDNRCGCVFRHAHRLRSFTRTDPHLRLRHGTRVTRDAQGPPSRRRLAALVQCPSRKRSGPMPDGAVLRLAAEGLDAERRSLRGGTPSQPECSDMGDLRRRSAALARAPRPRGGRQIVPEREADGGRLRSRQGGPSPRLQTSEHFRAKWLPIRVKKMRRSKRLEPLS